MPHPNSPPAPEGPNGRLRFLYVGGFELPDCNAAAQRVVGIAKALRALGHEVLFLNYTSSASAPHTTAYFGFSCHEYPKRSLYRQLTDIRDVTHLLDMEHIDCVLCYNYPAVALEKLLKACRRRGIKCCADATEWYVSKGRGLHSLIKTWDSGRRMKKLHARADGLIAISGYLYEYYRDALPTVLIPPLTDADDPKWTTAPLPAGLTRDGEETVFVYSGLPSAQKECLSAVVDAVEHTPRPARLIIVGITREQYERMYGAPYEGKRTIFLGRVSHQEAVGAVRVADWAVIIREENLVTRAGFPTKLVESIACGTPVIVNRFSNVADFVDGSTGLLCELSTLPDAVAKATAATPSPDRARFDYRHYTEPLADWLSRL